MTLQELAEHLELELVTKGAISKRKVEGGYASDLLSWVMAHARENDVWITIQSHQNIVAVASLLNLTAIIVAEGAKIDENTIIKADEVNIPIFSSKMSTYKLCGILYNQLSRSYA